MDLFSTLPPVDNEENLSDLLASLDGHQLAAATAPDGPVVVRAGAGTGKTRTLVARILHLVRDRGIDPSSIVAVTFTNKAAKEIRGRVAGLLGKDISDRLRVGTFHSLSARILRRHAGAAGLDPKFTVASEDDSLQVLMLAMEHTGIAKAAKAKAEGDEEERTRTVSDLARATASKIASWKSWGLTAAMAEDRERPRRDDADELAARLYVSYQHEMARRKLVDFGDLVLGTVDLLSRDDDIRHEEAVRVRHLLVDEAQDANPAQVRWARLVSSAYGNIFAVGDEDQSIFSFQGGYPGALTDLVGPDAARFTLVRNRRCTDEILAPAVELVGWNRRAAPKELSSGVSGEPVKLRVAGMEREEATAIASSIKEQVSAGTRPSEIAVLVRSSWAMKPVEEALLKAAIPYEVVGGLALTRREEILDLSAFIRLVVNPYDRFALSRVINKPARGIGPATEHAVCRHVDDGLPAYEAIRRTESVDGLRVQGNTREGLAHFAYVLEHMCELPDVTTSDLLKIIMSPDGMGYGKLVRTGKKSDRQREDNVKAFERLAAEEPDPVAFLQDLALSRDDDAPPDPDKVRISTMHSSKGLEWDVVYCPAFEMDVVPNRRAVEEVRSGTPGDPWNGPSGGGLEEERRLVHVAFTRARKQLFVSCSLNRGGRNQSPSPFVPESGLDPMMGADLAGVPAAPVRRARASRAAPAKGRKGFARPF